MTYRIRLWIEVSCISFCEILFVFFFFIRPYYVLLNESVNKFLSFEMQEIWNENKN